MNFFLDIVMVLMSLIMFVGVLAIFDIALLSAHYINKLRHKLGLGELV